MKDVVEIAGGLTAAQRRALNSLTSGWVAGPDLPADESAEMAALLLAGLVRREFADMHDPKYARTAAALVMRLRACWWFNLTPLGVEVAKALRAHLESQP